MQSHRWEFMFSLNQKPGWYSTWTLNSFLIINIWYNETEGSQEHNLFLTQFTKKGLNLKTDRRENRGKFFLFHPPFTKYFSTLRCNGWFLDYSNQKMSKMKQNVCGDEWIPVTDCQQRSGWLSRGYPHTEGNHRWFHSSSPSILPSTIKKERRGELVLSYSSSAGPISQRNTT